MFCRRCAGMLSEWSRDHPQWPSVWPGSSSPLSGLLCARCGVVLWPADFDRVLLSKLSQLSRFGLGADDRPVLVHLPTRKT